MSALIWAQQEPAGAGRFLASLLPILLIGLIFYLLIFLPMRKRQRSQAQLIANLKNGDKVITNSGIYGTIARVNDNTIQLKVADQVKIEIAKSAVASLQMSPQRPEK